LLLRAKEVSNDGGEGRPKDLAVLPVLRANARRDPEAILIKGELASAPMESHHGYPHPNRAS
jgi:hypothetical protein